MKNNFSLFAGERYDFVITADQPVGAYWIQLRGLGECGIKRAQQLAILRYARGPYQPASAAPTYDVGIPQGVVSKTFLISSPTEVNIPHPLAPSHHVQTVKTALEHENSRNNSCKLFTRCPHVMQELSLHFTLMVPIKAPSN